MNIEIVTTPNESFKETGFGNLNSCRCVLNSIKKMGHNVRLSSCKSLTDLDQISKRQPDLVILAVKYILTEGEEIIWLSEYFANMRIAYSGSSKDTIEFDSDKILAKRHLQDKGVATAPFFTATSGEFGAEDVLKIKYPLFLKPIGAANGNGVDEQSHVSSYSEFERKISALHKMYGQPVLVEKYLAGREFTVAIMNTKSGELLDSAIEIVPPRSIKGHRILSENIKKENTETLSKITEEDIKLEVRKLAFEVFLGLGVEGFARIDIKSDSSGKCFFMEANLVPGMKFGSSYFPEAFRIDLGMSYDQTISHIVEYCLSKETKTIQRSLTIPEIQTELAFS